MRPVLSKTEMSARGLPLGAPAAAKAERVAVSARPTAPRGQRRRARCAAPTTSTRRRRRVAVREGRTRDDGRCHGAQGTANNDSARCGDGRAGDASHAAQSGTQRAGAGACAPRARVSCCVARAANLTGGRVQGACLPGCRRRATRNASARRCRRSAPAAQTPPACALQRAERAAKGRRDFGAHSRQNQNAPSPCRAPPWPTRRCRRARSCCVATLAAR